MPRDKKPGAFYTKAVCKNVHCFDSIGTALRCITCLVNRNKSVVSSPCQYNVHALGHNIWAVPPFLFCVHCGGYTNDRVGALARLCPNKATTTHFVRAKARLLDGRHPVNNAWIAAPYPVCKIVFKDFIGILDEFDELEIVDEPDGAVMV